MVFLPHFEQNSVRLFCSKRYFLYICSKINERIMAQKIVLYVKKLSPLGWLN